ncbi:hypothetical protein PV327_002340 [Microctonus hyperodae]|uniref:Uncharacterized protein n=1 Tax=Microctonus hyperodae TaxID=165561 RepID=A0AA39FFD4_MICHY|nr:hypothetical protein PV327_002340 [Microctonus hyperodae]
MEVRKTTREKDYELECRGDDVCDDGDTGGGGGGDDGCEKRITTAQATLVNCDNGIEHLAMVQEMTTKLANCHSIEQQDGNKNNNDENIDSNNDGEREVDSRVDRDSLEKEIVENKGAQNHSALAFTIDFGDNKNVIESSRYQNLFQRYNARHKRNFSTSKIEIKEKPEVVGDLSPNFLQKYQPLSIHSEGYFSNEDDTKRKVDRLPQKLKELELTTNSKGAIMKKSDTVSNPGNSMHNNNKKRRSYHEESTNNSAMMTAPTQIAYSSTLNDLSKIQSSIEEDRNRVQYSPEKKYTKNIEYIEINHDDYNDETELEKFSLDATEKLSNMAYLSDNCPSLDEFASNCNKNANLIETMSVSYTGESTSCTDIDKTNLDVFNVSTLDASSDGTVSEAGTYTIHKDYTDEEKARMDIDKVFSVGVLTEEESNETYVHHFKMQSSRDTNTWITEWATQVAEHNSLPSTIGGGGGTMGRTPPLSPSKIPSPVYSRTPLRNTRNRYEQSDSSLDADIQHMRDKICLSSNQHGLIDSGGESDEDTSNSYNTPPHSSQRTPTHTTLMRRGSLSESLFKRVNNNDCRRSMRKYSDIKKNEDIILDVPNSPSHVLARLHLERGSSLDRKSDTAESNSSRRSSLKNYPDDNFKHTNSPILNRLRSVTPKLTNSPILSHKNVNIHTRIINSPSFERSRPLIKSNSQTKNIGYYTCVESSPYMLRKSNSTSNYREDTSLGVKEFTVINNSPMLNRNINIQRSTSNTSIRNMKTKNSLTRRSSFNDHHGDDRMSKGKIVVSDSSSETGETPNSTHPPISSGIKFNRAFSIRRARGCGDSDTTPNTTPEERRRKGQIEIKSAPSSARQTNHYRARTNSVDAGSKDTIKQSEALRPRVPSLSRNESGRYSMRAQKTSSSGAQSTRPNSKTNNNREIKNSGRSNSTLTSKEVEFQNWKRRKNYDPMKAAAEGKKKLDNSRKNHSTEDNCASRDNSVLRSASFHGTRGTLSLADNDWSDNEQQNFIEHREIIQIPPPCSPLGSDSDLDTSSYLQTTQNVMSAMSARITIYQTPAVDSGGESDEDTSHSLRQINKIHGPSDTESSDDAQVPLQPSSAQLQSSTGTKFTRTFGLRRGGDSQEVKLPSKNKVSMSNNSRKKSETITNSIARTDSGRFSMRMSKGSSSTNASSKTKPKDTKKQSGISSREQEMQNWKRRKSYDPMKAAMEGKKKAEIIKKNLNSESSSVLRSQSFHGQVSLGISEWSDEDVSASADEAPIY